MYEKYRAHQYIDNTGGFAAFDSISSEENYEKYKEMFGVSISCSDKKEEKVFGRAPTAEEAAIAFSMLGTRTPDKDSTTVYGRLEKTSSKDVEIGKDALVLDNGLVAACKMFRHTAWERGDAGGMARGGGEEWTYELDGVVVDVNKREVISAVNFSSVVRDAYNGSKDTHHLINAQTMVRADKDEVEFYIGDKYHTVASKKVDVDTALKIHESKKHINQSKQEKSTETNTSSKPNGRGGRGGNGGYSDGR